jgi:hypothetical protein
MVALLSHSYFAHCTLWDSIVIQGASKIFKGVIGEIVWNKNVNKITRFATFSELRRFCIDIAFVIVIVDLQKMETVRKKSQLIPSFTMKETKRENYALCNIFQSSLLSNFFRFLFCLCEGKLTSVTDLLLALLSESHNCALAVYISRTLSAELPSTITIILSDIKLWLTIFSE